MRVEKKIEVAVVVKILGKGEFHSSIEGILANPIIFGMAISKNSPGFGFCPPLFRGFFFL